MYRIQVQGLIPARWRDRLEGMAISMAVSAGSPPVTTLSGRLADQASLTGVLTALYELHLPVLLVECLGAGLEEADDRT